MPEQKTPPQGSGAAVQAAPAAQAPEQSQRPARERPDRYEARRADRPATPLERRQLVEPVPEPRGRTAQDEAGAAARLGLATPPEFTAPTVRAPGPPPDPVDAPLRIIAAMVGAALVAVPFATIALRHPKPPAPKPPVATFRVGDHDVRTFWPVPGSAGR